ncbi:MAG: LuxR C-terminal-related transcriptional regulator [Coriobacteriales bacterium]|jgi:DNA-binding CsgD family transcriptional regulator/MFS family permease|nr:LuxR C-terminal-related transcriptional regulator [Coriobacteriales bacterium]
MKESADFATEARGGKLPLGIPFIAGTSCLVAWFLIIYSGEVWGRNFSNSAESVVVLSVVSLAACAITMTALMIGNSLLQGRSARKSNKFITRCRRSFLFAFLFARHTNRVVAVVAGTMLFAGTLGVLFLPFVTTAMFIFAGIFCGIAGAFFLAIAGIYLATQSPRGTLAFCGAAFLVGILIYTFLLYAPTALISPLCASLPILAAIFYAFVPAAANHNCQQEDLLAHIRAVPVPTKDLSHWRSTLVFSTFILLSCIVRGYQPFYMDNDFFAYIRSISIIFMFLACACCVVAGLLLPEKFAMSRLTRWILIAGILFFVAIPIFGLENYLILPVTDAYRSLCTIFFAVFCTALQRRGNVATLRQMRQTAGSLTTFTMSACVGWVLGALFYYIDASGELLRIAASVQCIILVLVFILLFRESDLYFLLDNNATLTTPKSSSAPEQPNAKLGTEESLGRWQKKCHEIAASHSLTFREEEVFILLAKGYKAQNIASELFISYNTTRAHIRNIYSKCNVHSQQEFHHLINTKTDTK